MISNTPVTDCADLFMSSEIELLHSSETASDCYRDRPAAAMMSQEQEELRNVYKQRGIPQPW